MSVRTTSRLLGMLLLLLTGLLPNPVTASTPPFADPAVETVWRRTDQPVATQAVSRSWLWGPAPLASLYEPYDQAPGGWRLVQYYDKSRMEVTDATGDRSSPWFVTNGLLARELITGQVQLGDSRWEPRPPAEIPVAGDPDDTSGPLYTSFGGLLGREEPRSGPVTATLTRDGTVSEDASLGGHTDYVYYVPETGHNIPGVFWDYLNSEGPVQAGSEVPTERLLDPPFFATGYPISEAYWTHATVDGDVTDVLVQAFERRVLTYTPRNEPAWRVEMGNIGQHYYRWRYGDATRGLAVARVAHVIDGDTLEVHLGGADVRVRLLGLDTPAAGDHGECYGPEARAAAAGLLEGKTVLLERDNSDRDPSGNLLRYVYVDGLFVNDWLVRTGFARASSEPSPATYAPGLTAAQTHARASGAGLWSACAATPPTAPISPAPPSDGGLIVGSGGYSTIQAAVSAAPAGATLRIRAGTYPEQVTVAKPLTLVAYGDGPVWIDGGCSRSHGILVQAHDVTIVGLGIKRTDEASVFVDGTAGTRWARTSLNQLTLQDFNCAGQDGQHFGGFAGFYTGPGVRITNSTITHSVELARPQPGATDCIWFKSTSERPSGGGHYLAGNTITGCRDGIGGESEDDPHGSFDQDTLIEGNRVRACYDDGIQVEGGNRNVVVRGNQIEECGIGIALAPNLVGPLTVEGNVIRSRSVGVYGQLACFKVGDGGQGTAYLTNNRCTIVGPDDESGDGLKQTNSDIGSIVSRGNHYHVTRYVYEFTSIPGGSFDGDCLWTSDPNRFIKWGGDRYDSLADFQGATGQEPSGVQRPDCG